MKRLEKHGICMHLLCKLSSVKYVPASGSDASLGALTAAAAAAAAPELRPPPRGARPAADRLTAT